MVRPARGGWDAADQMRSGGRLPRGHRPDIKTTRMSTASAISATGCVSRASPGENPAGRDSPNTKYRSRSALLQERASKLVSGGGESAAGVEPAMIRCEARRLVRVA